MRIVFELKRGEQAEVILNNLYKHTQLQIGFGIIMLSIVNGQPRELGLVDMIRLFIDHRIDVVRRRTEYELRKAREREHLLLGFQKALDHLDEVIALVRAAKTPKEARDSLVARFEFTEKQAQAIIELQQRLTGMSARRSWTSWRISSGALPNTWNFRSEKCCAPHHSGAERNSEVFGDARRTEIIEDTGDPWKTWSPEDVAVSDARRLFEAHSVDTYRRQTRGGKGRIGMGTRRGFRGAADCRVHSRYLLTTTRGRVYWLKAYEIPDASTTGSSTSRTDQLQPDETAKAFLSVKDFVPDQFIVMATKHGVIKKSELTEFDNPMLRGIIAVSWMTATN
jgi:DNA gyrase subunit A